MEIIPKEDSHEDKRSDGSLVRSKKKGNSKKKKIKNKKDR